MSKEEEFKRLLNDMVESKEFSFDEANWQNARQMMDDNRRKRKAIYFILPALLLLLSVPAWLLFAPAGQEESSPVAVNTPATGPAAPEKAAELPAVVKEEAPAAKPAPEAATPAAKPAATAPSVESPAPATPAKNTAKAPESTVVKNAQPAPAIKEPQPAIEPVVKSAPAIKPSKPAEQEPANTTPVTKVSATPALNEPAVKAGQSTPPVIAENNGGQASATNPGNNGSEVTEKAPEPIASNELPTSKKENPVEPPVTTPEQTNTIPVQTQPEANSPAVVKEEAPATKAAQTEAVEQAPPVAAAQPTQAEAAMPDTSARKDFLFKDGPHTLLFAEAGSIYTMGWNNPVKTDAKGFNPVLGIVYSTALAKKLVFSFGAQYTSVSGLEYSSRTSKITRYRLGEESDVTVITPTTLHYASIPLKLGYAFSNDHIVGIGYNFNCLLTVTAKVETYHQGLVSMQNYASKKTTGYTEGFLPYDSQVSVFYRARLFGRLWAGAELMYGLSDVKDDEFFGVKGFERNSGFKLSLMYNFYRK